jgi:DNA-binding NarL/FixJ family response regulator
MTHRKLVARDPRTGPMTRRELQVLELILDGYNNSAIAARLRCQHDTVRRHIYNMFGKAGVSSRLDLAVTVLKARHAKELAERKA